MTTENLSMILGSTSTAELNRSSKKKKATEISAQDLLQADDKALRNLLALNTDVPYLIQDMRDDAPQWVLAGRSAKNFNNYYRLLEDEPAKQQHLCLAYLQLLSMDDPVIFYNSFKGIKSQYDPEINFEEILFRSEIIRKEFFKQVHLLYENLNTQQLAQLHRKNKDYEDRLEQARYDAWDSDYDDCYISVPFQRLDIQELAWFRAIKNFSPILDLTQEQLETCYHSHSGNSPSLSRWDLNTRISMDKDARALWANKARMNPNLTPKEIARDICQDYLDGRFVSGGPLASLFGEKIIVRQLFFWRKQTSCEFMTRILNYLQSNQDKPYDELLAEISYRMMASPTLNPVGRSSGILRIIIGEFVNELKKELSPAPSSSANGNALSYQVR
jgi:hypothetical protein